MGKKLSLFEAFNVCACLWPKANELGIEKEQIEETLVTKCPTTASGKGSNYNPKADRRINIFHVLEATSRIRNFNVSFCFHEPSAEQKREGNRNFLCLVLVPACPVATASCRNIN